MAGVWEEKARPEFERQLARLDPIKDRIKRVLLIAYLARMDHAVYFDSEGDSARMEMEEIEELSPLVNPWNEISWEQELSFGLYEIHLKHGLTHAESYAALGEGRKRNTGRPVNLIAIEALQMKLDGKTIYEIADTLCDYNHSRDGEPYSHDYQDHFGCIQRFKKSIARVKKIYDKFKSLN